jgi:hypothetical protein
MTMSIKVHTSNVGKNQRICRLRRLAPAPRFG